MDDLDSERILVALLDQVDARACVVATSDEAPLLARTLARAQRIDLPPHEVGAEALPEEATRLASLIASLGGSVPTRLALDHGTVAAIDALDDHGLLDWTRDASTVVLARVPPNLPPVAESELRRVVEDLGDAPVETRAGLRRFLGDHAHAVPDAIESGRRALDRGAPSSAERWLRYALQHDDRAETHALLSRALADQTRPLDAAEQRTLAAQRVEGAARGHHLAEASDLWLRAGEVDMGLATLTEACHLLGFSLPRGRWGARYTTVVDLLWLRRNALELEPVEQPEPPRLVAAWAAACPLAYFEFTQAAAMLIRYLRMALEDGHVDHACRAGGLLWNALALSGSNQREAERLDAFLDRWTPRAGPITQAFIASCRAYVMLYTEEIGASPAAFADALALYPPTEDGGWSLSAARVNRLLALHLTAPADAAWCARVERLSQVLRERSDRIAGGLCELGLRYLVPLYESGDVDRARAIVDAEVARQGRRIPAAYAWITSFARTRIALFAGEPRAAREAIGRRPPRELASLQHVRTAHAWLRGLSEVALADAGERWSVGALRRSVRILHDEQPHWGVGHAEALGAALAALEDRPAEARNRTRRALSLYTDAGLSGFVDANDRDRPWRSLFWPVVPGPDHSTVRVGAVTDSPSDR